MADELKTQNEKKTIENLRKRYFPLSIPATAM
jgi:hypothetical protein